MNINDMIDESVRVIKDVRSGKLTTGQAGAINNAVRNTVAIVALQINYAQAKGSTPSVKALEAPKG